MPTSLTHLQSRRRSSVARITRSRYQQLPAPSRLTFYPNLTPTTYVGPEAEDVKQDQLADASPQPESSNSPALLFPPPSNVSGPKRKRQRPGRRISQGYIPRPANSFMLFRADFVRQKRIPDSVEVKHGTLSRIIGSVWRSLPPHERDEWEKRAEKEKEEHKKQYPDYKFRPIHKNKVPSSRKSTSKSSKFPRRTRGHDDHFDDSDYEDVQPAASSKRPRTKSPLPPANQVLSLDNAPPSTYTPGSFRFAFATLREERQEYITQCLVQGVQKRPVQSLLGPLNPEEEIPGDWLEDYVGRWDLEKNYLQVRAAAEKEEDDEKEAAAAFSSSSQVKQELGTESIPTMAQHPTLTRYRRSSSQPLPDEFAHHYHHPYAHAYAHTAPGQVHVHGFSPYAGQSQPQQSYAAEYHSHVEHLHPNNGYDYPQAQEAYHYNNSDHINANYPSYDQGQVYTSYTDTGNSWGTNVSPLSQPLHPSVPHPSTVHQSYTIGSNETTPNIALPQLPTTMTSSFPSSIPSSTPSPAMAPNPLSSNSSYPTGSSYTNAGFQATNATNTGGFGYRYSPSGRALPGRRASSAEPCLTSQYTSGPFTGYSDPSSAWGHQQFHIQGHGHGHIQSREGYEQQKQEVEERDAVEEMEELEFDPSAVQGWNPNFNFGVTQTSTASQVFSSSTPAGIDFTGISTNNAVHPHYIYSSSSYVGSAGSVPHCQSPAPLNLDMSCTSQSPLDPLDPGPSPISTVSAISAVSAVSPSSPPSSSLQVYAPQPITPSSVQHFEHVTGGTNTTTSMTMNGDEDVHMEVEEEEDTPTPPQLAPIEDTGLQVGRSEERVDAAQVFTDLWKGLSSSQSFCMGRLGSMPGYPGDVMAMESQAEFRPAGQNDAYGERY